MKIAAHQPNFLPNLAFFNKMKIVDKFIIITNLQFEKQEGWQQRHKIFGKNGEIWLTVPVLGSQNQLIKDVKINNKTNWQKKHKKSIELTYSKSSGKDLLPKILSIYDKKYERLVDLNVAAIKMIRDLLEIETPLIVDEEVEGSKEILITNICKKYNADIYLSGVGVKLYLDRNKLESFGKSGIKHELVKGNLTADYPYSTIHYLLVHGKDWVKKVIS